MSSNYDRINRQRLANPSKWTQEYKVEDYINNPPLIDKLYEEKQSYFAKTLDLEEKLERKTSELITLRLENQKLSSKLDEVRGRSWPIFLTSVVSSVLFGFGTNIATGDSHQETGWMMVILGIVLLVVERMLLPK